MAFSNLAKINSVRTENLHIDDLMDKLFEEKFRILNDLVNSSKPMDLYSTSITPYINVDRNCQLHGMDSIPHLHKKKISCIRCLDIQKFLQGAIKSRNREPDPNKGFLIPIETGDFVGDFLEITKMDAMFLFFTEVSIPSFGSILASKDELNSCCNKSQKDYLRAAENWKYIAVDEFTSNTLISYILESKFSNRSFTPDINPNKSEESNINPDKSGETSFRAVFKPTKKYLSSFVCGDVGYFLSIEKTDNILRDRLNIVNKGNFYTLVQQLLLFLRETKELNFSHGSATKENLSFFNGKLGIRNFTKSAVTIYSETIGKRIFSSSTDSIHLLEKTISENIMGLNDLTAYEGFYSITRSNKKTIQDIRRAGVPLYTSSFDFYSFLSSLLMDSYIRALFIPRDNDLIGFISRCFPGDEIQQVIENFSLGTEYIAIEDHLDCLIGLKLVCDIEALDIMPN